jgi:hypothetical protein
MPQQHPLGTISPDALFGPNNSVVAKTGTVAAASGLQKSNINPALWVVGGIVGLVLVRVAWETAKRR